MKQSFALFVTLFLAALACAQTPLVINTPANAVQCEPVLLTWSGGVAPYDVVRSVIPGGDPSGTPIEDLGEQDGTSLTWDVNVPAGLSVGLEIKDSSGSEAFTSPLIIQASDDDSCL